MRHRLLTDALTALAIATGGFLLVAVRIDVGDTLPTAVGPGLALDEGFNIEQGVYLANALGQHGWRLLTPAGAARVFGEDSPHLPDHPPLGRLLIGLAHEAVHVFAVHANDRMVASFARLSSALLFAATVWLVTFFVCRAEGRVAGIVAGVALLMMPRVVGHARLSSLETAMGFFYAAAVLAAARTADIGHRSDTRRIVVAGLMIGLALLTKIQAIFLPATLVFWLVLTRKFGGVRSAIVLLLTAGVVFGVFWPWLWLDPIQHVRDYFVQTNERQTVYNFYFGSRFGAPPPANAAVPAVPWHYTMVMFLTTVPIGLHILGIGGLWLALKDKLRDWKGAVVFAFCVPLAAFSFPGTPVYDGTRLFLIVYPLWAVLIGVAFSWAWNHAITQASRRLRTLLLAGLAAQSVGVVISGPFCLSYYNLLLGGTPGAHALGMECSYWGEGATDELWQRVPEGSTVFVAPVLHQNQLPWLTRYIPSIRHRNITLKSFQYGDTQSGLLLLLHRRADLRPALERFASSKPPVAQTRLLGVPLATLIENDGAEWRRVAPATAGQE